MIFPYSFMYRQKLKKGTSSLCARAVVIFNILLYTILYIVRSRVGEGQWRTHPHFRQGSDELIYAWILSFMAFNFSLNWYFIAKKHEIVYIKYTLRHKSLWPLASVCYKTTLNTGDVGGAGPDPQTWKRGTYFFMSLALGIPIFNNFQLNGASGGTLKHKFPLLL